MAGSRMKPLPKLILLVAIAAVIVFGGRAAINRGWIPGAGILQAIIPQKAVLPDVKDATVADVKPSPYPSTTPNGCQDPIRAEIWAWNAQMGWLYSNGGVDTTKGSVAEKYGVCLHFTRQDDTTQMKNDLIACAQDLKNSTECSSGQHNVTIMADGSGQFLAQYNAEAKKICADCTAEIIGTTGFSRGEDALWGPESWKSNPRSALGDGLISGVERDGDWNTALKWAGDNNLKNNPDEKTYDADALNWVNAADYIKAAEMYIAGYCEDRKVAKDGKLTGEVKNVCVKAVVTWTPGDVNLAKKKGGLARIVSTKQYRSQMVDRIPTSIVAGRVGDHRLPTVAASPCETVQRANHVGIVAVVAPKAPEHLSPPVFPRRRPTARACSGGVSRIVADRQHTVLLRQLLDPRQRLPICPRGDHPAEIFGTIFLLTVLDPVQSLMADDANGIPRQPADFLVDVLVSRPPRTELALAARSAAAHAGHHLLHLRSVTVAI
jgi:hypothetical protein